MSQIITSENALKAQTVLWDTGVSSRIVGWGYPPTEPYYQDGQRLEILKPEMESTMPGEVLKRLDRLKRNGIVFSHILIAHEENLQAKRLQVSHEHVVKAGKKIIEVSSLVLPVLGSILWALVTAVMWVVTALFQLIVMVLVADPAVIIVIPPDDPSGKPVWLEIARWFE